MLISLSRKSNLIIRQNITSGVLFILCGIILSIFGWLGPVVAAILHSFSTLIIIFNSARLLRAGEEATTHESSLWRQGLQMDAVKQ